MFSTPGFSARLSRKLETGDALSLFRHPVTGTPAPLPDPESVSSDSARAPVELEMLYRDQRHILMRFFARYRASPDDARDLVQETFLRLSSSDALKGGLIAQPEAYLRTIARNLLRNRAKLAIRHCDAAHVDIADQPVPAACEVKRLEARDGLARLEAAMRKLKPKTREIFMAHRLDGLSYREIAAVTGLSVKGVEKQMHKALVHIDRCMGQP